MSISRKSRAVLLLLATLVIGYLSGIGSSSWFHECKKPQKHRGLPEVPSDEHLDSIASKYREMLDLSDEQYEVVRKEVFACVDGINVLNDEFRPRYKKMWEERREAIASHLDERQLTLYKAHHEERKRRYEERSAKSQDK